MHSFNLKCPWYSLKVEHSSVKTLKRVQWLISGSHCFFPQDFFVCFVLYILHISCSIRAESSNIYEYPCMWKKKHFIRLVYLVQCILHGYWGLFGHLDVQIYYCHYSSVSRSIRPQYSNVIRFMLCLDSVVLFSPKKSDYLIYMWSYCNISVTAVQE